MSERAAEPQADCPHLAAFLARHGDKLATFSRRDDIALLLEPGGVGVELGVAEGRMSDKILRRSELSFLYSIDWWSGDRGHDVEEYKTALRILDPHRARNSTLRLSFAEALDLFPDDHFDFVYVDGYAHTGEEAAPSRTGGPSAARAACSAATTTTRPSRWWWKRWTASAPNAACACS